MKKRIGVYQLGNVQVETFYKDEFGASFNCDAGKGKLPEIVLGFGPGNWRTIISYMLHEAFEMTAALLQSRYDPGDYGRDSSNYLFVFSHQVFSDICGRVAIYLEAALPEVAKAWKKFKKEAQCRSKSKKSKSSKRSGKRNSRRKAKKIAGSGKPVSDT